MQSFLPPGPLMQPRSQLSLHHWASWHGLLLFRAAKLMHMCLGARVALWCQVPPQLSCLRSLRFIACPAPRYIQAALDKKWKNPIDKAGSCCPILLSSPQRKVNKKILATTNNMLLSKCSEAIDCMQLGPGKHCLSGNVQRAAAHALLHCLLWAA